MVYKFYGNVYGKFYGKYDFKLIFLFNGKCLIPIYGKFVQCTKFGKIHVFMKCEFLSFFFYFNIISLPPPLRMGRGRGSSEYNTAQLKEYPASFSKGLARPRMVATSPK